MRTGAILCACVCVEFVHATWHHLCLCTRTGGCGSASRRSGRDREREREREREKFIDNRERGNRQMNIEKERDFWDDTPSRGFQVGEVILFVCVSAHVAT